MMIRIKKKYFVFSLFLILGFQQICIGQLKINTEKVMLILDEKPDSEYILNNINRQNLLSSISNWGKDRKTVLSEDVKINILVDYLRSEKEFIDSDFDEQKVKSIGLNILWRYLDYFSTNTEDKYWSIINMMDDSLKSKSFLFPQKNKYGRLKINSIPEQSEVYIDDEFIN